ncbi:MAG TPA: hypothetical protein VJY39_03930 [Acidisphaera sp.]|nr:hypothetical protein [Acidisphaera sp.]
MKQPHTERGIKHTDGAGDIGTHKKPGDIGSGGADTFGGTREGAENVEKTRDTPHNS